MASINTWSTTTLCKLLDITTIEPNLSPNGNHIENLITQVKSDIGIKIRAYVHKNIQIEYGSDYQISDFPTELCDMVQNPEVFKNANVYGALYLFYLGSLNSASETSQMKIDRYSELYKTSLKDAFDTISIDLDASGTITGGRERYKGWAIFGSQK